MERRQFLKLAGYRGTRDGRILVSEDGKTWSLHTTFGHDYSVKHLDVVQDRVTAHLGSGIEASRYA